MEEVLRLKNEVVLLAGIFLILISIKNNYFALV
jgi:hypothetical protein